MIDYILAFADEPTAQADPVVGAYYIPDANGNPGAWRGDICIPNMSVTVTATGQPLDSQWRIVIALPARNAALDASPALGLVTDRDAANAGAPMSTFVLYSNVPLASLSALQVSPVFAGSNYPFGGSP